MLIFSTALLNERTDYHGSYSLNYGAISSSSIFEWDVKNRNLNLKDLREICFENPIDLSKYLVEIWVHPTKKDAVLDELKHKVSPAWLRTIVSYEFYPPIEQYLADIKARNQKSDNDEKRITENRYHFYSQPVAGPNDSVCSSSSMNDQKKMDIELAKWCVIL